MQNGSHSTEVSVGKFHAARCCGHRRSSSLPVGPINDGAALTSDKDEKDSEQATNSVDISGLVDTLHQISDTLQRPTRILGKILDTRNKNDVDNPTMQLNGSFVDDQVEIAIKQLNNIQGNLHHVLPHMQSILQDYRTTKERTQSRDEMLKTLDKALRRSEASNRTLRGQLQDLRDENKCLTEKARQNESILRYLEKGKEQDNPLAVGGSKGSVKDKRKLGGSIRLKRDTGGIRNDILTKKSHSVGNMSGLGTNQQQVGSDTVDHHTRNFDTGLGFNSRQNGHPEVGTNTGSFVPGVTNSRRSDPGVEDLWAKFGHYQKVLRDNETQLAEVIALNKDLVLKINVKENEIMRLNRELLRHQETLSVYERGFRDLTQGNSEIDAKFREERIKNAKLTERLEDSEGYINCITDKIASYEVELKYLRQQLRKSNNHDATDK